MLGQKEEHLAVDGAGVAEAEAVVQAGESVGNVEVLSRWNVPHEVELSVGAAEERAVVYGVGLEAVHDAEARDDEEHAGLRQDGGDEERGVLQAEHAVPVLDDDDIDQRQRLVLGREHGGVRAGAVAVGDKVVEPLALVRKPGAAGELTDADFFLYREPCLHRVSVAPWRRLAHQQPFCCLFPDT